MDKPPLGSRGFQRRHREATHECGTEEERVPSFLPGKHSSLPFHNQLHQWILDTRKPMFKHPAQLMSSTTRLYSTECSNFSSLENIYPRLRRTWAAKLFLHRNFHGPVLHKYHLDSCQLLPLVLPLAHHEKGSPDILPFLDLSSRRLWQVFCICHPSIFTFFYR